MFSIRQDNSPTRRAFLRVGAFGLGALGLPGLLHGNASVDKPWVRGKSVVWLWLGGGPPQAETRNPKPDAPDGVRTMFGTVKTSLPGIAFGSHFPKLAERANRLVVVRSFQTPCKDHQENWVRTMLTGTEATPSPPSAGSVFSFLRGNTPGDLPEAYQLDREDAKTVERYDTSDITLTCPNFLNLPDFPRRPSMLGRQMLLARRLCEAGAGLVMVENCGWDFHNEGLNPGMQAGLEGFGPQLDQAVSAFLDDVQDRGLDDRILLVVCGEMGRTPKINPKGGARPLADAGPAAARRRRVQDGPGDRQVRRPGEPTDDAPRDDRRPRVHRVTNAPRPDQVAPVPKHPPRPASSHRTGDTDSWLNVTRREQSHGTRTAVCGRLSIGRGRMRDADRSQQRATAA